MTQIPNILFIINFITHNIYRLLADTLWCNTKVQIHLPRQKRKICGCRDGETDRFITDVWFTYKINGRIILKSLWHNHNLIQISTTNVVTLVLKKRRKDGEVHFGNGGVGGARECCIAAAIFLAGCKKRSFSSDWSDIGGLEEQAFQSNPKPERK